MPGELSAFKPMHQRYRSPGNLIFATLFLALSFWLLSQLGGQAKWTSSGKWSSQPALWPGVAVVGMTVFAALNWFSSVISKRTAGRWQEVAIWIRSFEFVLWFMAYVFLVPRLGYLPSTVVFATALTVRCGYRSSRMIGAAAATSVMVVVLFKSFLQVKVPGGLAYEYLPDTMRSIMLTYF